MNKHLMTALGLIALIALIGCGASNSSVATRTTSPPPTLAINSSTPPGGSVGTSYAGPGFLLSASGGTPPYQWSWSAQAGSSLPAGLSLSSSGLISGTPQMGATYNVAVSVTDSEVPASQVTADYTIAIAGLAALTITSGTPPNGTVGVNYGPMTTTYWNCSWSPVLGWHLVCTPCPPNGACRTLPPCRSFSPNHCLSIRQVFGGFTYTAAGGVPPYTWNGLSMPPGLAIDPATGQVSGTPTTAGSYNMSVSVTDDASPPSQTSTIDVVNFTSSSGRCIPKGMQCMPGAQCCPGLSCVPASTRAFCE